MNNIESNNYGSNSSNYKSRNNYSANFVGKSKNDLNTQKTAPSINEKPPETNKKKTEDKAKNVSGLVTKFVAVVSSAVIGVAGVEAISPYFNNYYVDMEDCYATENAIYYNVYIENKNRINKENYDIEYEDNMEVFTLVLYNDFVNYSEEFEDNYIDGVFEDLKPNMTYNLAVKANGRTIATKSLTTVGRTKPNTSDDPTTGP